MDNLPLCSFVIPAFNEEQNILLLYQRITETVSKIEGNCEIIFVNDGSFDNTLLEIKKISNTDKTVKFIDLSRNFGHQAALSAGFAQAKGELIISLDCDLQDPPEIIIQMIEKYREGYDIVYAKRKNYRQDSILKRTGSKIFYKLLKNNSQIKLPGNVGDYRLITRRVLNEINRMPEHSRYLRGMVAWTGFRHAFVEYLRPDRQAGESGYSISKLANLGMNGMLNFSNLPLRLGLFIGLTTIVIGFSLLLFQIFDALFNNVYYHLYKWLVVVLFIFTGFLFLLIWIIGEYLGKIYDEVRNRPLYIIKETGNL